MIAATAGHIDHGKTTLVKALTGVDTDRLPEEKARGISIDLGFAYWPVPGVGTVGFVDVPGHERFVRNMLAGVCGIDYVILVVAADDGVMPQTVEHLSIVDLLRVSRGIAVITKIDRAGSERVDEVVASVQRLLAGTSLAGAEVLRVSATSGAGMETLRERLRAAAAEQARRDYEGHHFRYAIDRVFTIPGSGTVVTGTVFTGAVAVGDRLDVAPAAMPVRVRAIQHHGEASQRAVAGERCALNLTGVEVAQIARGDWVVAAPLATPTRQFDARVQVLASEMHAVKHWTPVHVHIGTADVTARLATRRGSAIAPGASGHARLLLDRPLCALHGDRFILRDQSATRTVGGGVVIDPFPPRTRRDSAMRRAQLDALEHDDPRTALAGLLASTPGGVDVDWFERAYNLTAQRSATIRHHTNAIVIGKAALQANDFEKLKVSVVERLMQFHRQSPQAAGAAIDDLRESVAPHLAAATFLALLRAIADTRAIEIAASLARLPQHVTTANPADEKLWRRVEPALAKAGYVPLPVADLAASMRIDEKILRDFLHRKSRTGELVRVGDQRFFLRATLARLAGVANATAASAPDGKFSAAQFRDSAGIGRSLAIEILETLDRLGITQRVGDARKLRKDFVPILGSATASPGQPKR